VFRLGSGEGDAEEIMISPFFSDIDWNLLEKRKLIPPFKPQVDIPVKYIKINKFCIFLRIFYKSFFLIKDEIQI